jgi:N-methylhydantoinase A/oxoprolinase/acetone carboxylase beta subunit
VIRIANANMSRAIRSVSTERGYDLGEFALFAYGGAGPLHATDIAAECGIPDRGRAAGAGHAVRARDAAHGYLVRFRAERAGGSTPESWRRACALFAAMEDEAGAWLGRERVALADRSYRCHVDARYEGQNFEVIVPLAHPGEDGMDAFVRAFHAAHRQEYGYDLPGKAIEIVNCRLQAVGARSQGAPDRIRNRSGHALRTGPGASGPAHDLPRRSGRLARHACLPPRRIGSGMRAERPGRNRGNELHHTAGAGAAGEGG